MRFAALALALLAAPSAFGQTDAARVQAAAETLLAERFPDWAGRLAPRGVRAPALDGAAIRLDLVAGAEMPEGHTVAEVLAADGRRIGQATLYVAHWDSVAVASHALARGDTVTAADFAPAWIETTRLRTPPLRWADARRLADAATVRRSVGAGDALRASDHQAPPAVETGDPVEVRYRRGDLALTLRGQARERGALGEAVRVYCPDVRTTYRVRLVAPGVGEWLETL
jgi:flagella basal body P-ring formation protein FlgA